MRRWIINLFKTPTLPLIIGLGFELIFIFLDPLFFNKRNVACHNSKGSLIIWIQRTLNQKNLKLKEWNLQYCLDQFFCFSLALYWFCMKIFTKFSFSLSLSLSPNKLLLLTRFFFSSNSNGCWLLPPPSLTLPLTEFTHFRCCVRRF